jgi:hypothetical protein
MALKESNAVDAGLVEELVKKHFGDGFTSLVTRDVVLGRYKKSDRPDVIAKPRKVLFLTLGYDVVGQFQGENGSVLEIWFDAYKENAEAFLEDYKTLVKKDLTLHFLKWDRWGH